MANHTLSAGLKEDPPPKKAAPTPAKKEEPVPASAPNTRDHAKNLFAQGNKALVQN